TSDDGHLLVFDSFAPGERLRVPRPRAQKERPPEIDEKTAWLEIGKRMPALLEVFGYATRVPPPTDELIRRLEESPALPWPDEDSLLSLCKDVEVSPRTPELELAAFRFVERAQITHDDSGALALMRMRTWLWSGGSEYH